MFFSAPPTDISLQLSFPSAFYLCIFSWMCFAFFSDISSAGLWNIAEPVSLAQQACPGCPFSDKLPLPILQRANKLCRLDYLTGQVLCELQPQTNLLFSRLTTGCCFPGSQLLIMCCSPMLISSSHKAFPVPTCHFCRWDAAEVFRSCQQDMHVQPLPIPACNAAALAS